MKKKILDHGSLRLVESWGSDERIIEMARESVGGQFVSWEPYAGHPTGDIGLLRRLTRKRHTGPFEFSGMTVEIEAPVAVIWQWTRHRTQSYSIMSSRYIEVDEPNYMPTSERCLHDPGTNKQAAGTLGSATLTGPVAEQWLDELSHLYDHGERVYRRGLAAGIPKELARLALTFGRYFGMAATANLKNWLDFLTLRMDSEAQYEIREYTQAVGELIAEKFPRTWALYSERKA